MTMSPPRLANDDAYRRGSHAHPKKMSASAAIQRPPADSEQSWTAFTTATTSREFLQGWLDVVCSRFPGIRGAALLIKDQAGTSLVPAAVWPTADLDLSHLSDTVSRCVQQHKGLVEPLVNALPIITRVAHPIIQDEQIVGAVVLEMQADASAAASVSQHLHWGLGWLLESFQRLAMQEAQAQARRIGSVTQALAVAMQPRKLREVLFEIVNDIQRRMNCARVGIGLVNNETVLLAALSDAAWLEKSSPLSRQYAAAMEEALDGRALLVYPALPAPDPATRLPVAASGAAAAPALPQHQRLADAQHARRVLSLPLEHGAKCVAIMTLEWHGATDCTTENIAWLKAYGALLPGILEDKRQAEKGFLEKLRDAASALAARLFGPRHLLWKSATVLALLLVALLVLLPVDYRVTAKAVLEGQTQRVAVAPFDGFVASAPVRAGDIVAAGQLLAQLDDRDLKLEAARWSSERDQYERKLREAMAAHEMSNLQIYDAQVRQADAQLRLANEKIVRARISAPYAGVVVSGDLSQMIGSPVETGKKLFEIAPLEQYRIVLQVDEKEIRFVAAGQSGHIVVSGVNDDPMPLRVTKVTPVASAQDGKNTFRVEAALSGDISPRLRPGMEGVGKVAVASRSLWWVITHGFTDWLRLTLWNWLP